MPESAETPGINTTPTPPPPEAASGQRSGGRRVVFVDPPSVIQEQMIHVLVTAQYEAAILKDPKRIEAVLRRFPNAIVYFNVDSHMAQPALEKLVRSVVDGKPRHGADVGILSYNPNPELARLYLMEIGASCGYITLNIGLEKSARIIIKALEAAEARGDRRFVRVRVPAGKGSINVNIGGSAISGTVLDISEAGMACQLDRVFPIGTTFDDIQLRLWGNIVRVSGTIAGTRSSPEGLIVVLMFDRIDDAPARSKLYAFLKRVMQHEVDSVL